MSLLFRVAKYRSFNWCFRRDWIGGYWGIERVLGFQLDSNLYLVFSLFPNPSPLSVLASLVDVLILRHGPSIKMPYFVSGSFETLVVFDFVGTFLFPLSLLQRGIYTSNPHLDPFLSYVARAVRQLSWRVRLSRETRILCEAKQSRLIFFAFFAP